MKGNFAEKGINKTKNLAVDGDSVETAYFPHQLDDDLSRVVCRRKTMVMKKGCPNKILLKVTH